MRLNTFSPLCGSLRRRAVAVVLRSVTARAGFRLGHADTDHGFAGEKPLQIALLLIARCRIRRARVPRRSCRPASTSALRGHTCATVSIAMIASISVPPWPPSFSGIVMPSKPLLRDQLRRHPTDARRVGARASAPSRRWRSANPRTASRKVCCSPVSSKFIATILR